MKHILLLALATLPIFGFSQFNYEANDDMVKVGSLGYDLKFDSKITNLTSSVQTVRWRLTVNDFPTTEWSDYVCDEICYTSVVRTNDIDLKPDTVFPINHYISMKDMHGEGNSTICFFDPNDSANTVQCLTIYGYSTPMIIQDTIAVVGTSYVVIEGTVYEVDNSTYTEYANGYVLDAGGKQFIVIDGVIYDYVDGEFVEYEDETTVEVAGTVYHIVNGYAFTKDGDMYTEVGAYYEITYKGEDALVIGSDTFVIHSGSWAPLGTEEVAEVKPLSQNKPNPFSGTSVVEYNYEGSNGVIRIHDLTGKMVQQINLQNNQGRVTIGSDLNAGLYFYSLWSDGQMIDTMRMQVID